MKTVMVILVLVLWAGTAGAQCTTQTIFMPDGRVLFCQTCGSTTTCF